MLLRGLNGSEDEEDARVGWMIDGGEVRVRNDVMICDGERRR